MTWRVFFLALAALGFMLPTAFAIRPLEPGDPRVLPPPEPLNIPAVPQTSASAPTGLAEVFPAPWTVTMDGLTGRPHRIRGGRLWWAWSPDGRAEASGPFLAALRERCDEFLAARAGLFGAAKGELTYDAAASMYLQAADLACIRYQRVWNHIPVMGSGLSFFVKEGCLIEVAGSNLGAIDIDTAPGTSAAEAMVASWKRLLGPDAAAAGGGGAQGATAELRVLPVLAPGNKPGFRLIWVVVLPEGAGRDEFHAWVDAHNGAFVAFFPRSMTACAAYPDPLPRRLTGGVRPVRGDDAEIELPFRGTGVVAGSTLTTDSFGLFPYSGGEAHADLTQPYFNILCISCSDPAAANAPAAPDGNIRLGMGPLHKTDLVGNGISNPSERNALFHLSNLRLLARHWLVGVVTWLDAPLTVEINANNACNAMWTGFRIKTFRENDECRNTAHVADVFAHEWGHGLDDNDGNGTTDRALGEGMADLLAVLYTRDPCVAESLYVDPAVGPASGCDGVRCLDEYAAGLAHSPTTLRLDDNDCGSASHCLGEVLGQAFWHLYKNFSTGRSYDDNSSIPGGALDEESAWYHLERLYFNARPLAEVLDPNAQGMSVYEAFALADADSFGRHPFAAYYNDAFDHHGLIEGSPAVADNRCSRPTAPVVRSTPGYDAGTGVYFVDLTFADVGADYYRCYRRDYAGGPMLPTDYLTLGSLGMKTFRDSGLKNGTVYEYLLRAFEGTRCISSGTNLVTVNVALPEAVITRQLTSDARPGGNGNSIIEPGESIDLKLALAEMGGFSGLSQVSVSLETDDPDAILINAGPVGFGDFAPGEEKLAPARFRFFVAPTHTCGTVIPLRAFIESAEGCFFDRFEIPIPLEACPTDNGPELSFAGAAVVSDDANPDCHDDDLVLDNDELVEIEFRYANSSGVDAVGGRVEITMTDPRLLVLSENPVEFTDTLAPGQTGASRFTVMASRFDCRETTSITVELQAKQSAVVRRGTMRAVVEEDFQNGLLRFDFEDGPQGWTAEGKWAVSAARGNPDDTGQSFYSGADTNMCFDLMSPLVTLADTDPLTLELSTWFKFQPMFQAKFWDGAKVYIESGGAYESVQPVAGRSYVAALFMNHPCDPGASVWTGDLRGTSWASSTFDLTPWRGKSIHVIVRAITDNNNTYEGIYIDDVVISNAVFQGCDRNHCLSLNDCSAPQMTIWGPTRACTGPSLGFSATFDYLGTGDFDFEWDFGDGSRATAGDPQATVEHAYDLPGHYDVVLRAIRKDNVTCNSFGAMSLVVDPGPIADAGLDTLSPSVIGTPGNLTYTYAWSPAAGLSDPTIPTPTAAPTETTEYCVNVTDSATGCSSGDCTLVYHSSSFDLTCPPRLMLTRAGGDVDLAWDAVPAPVRSYRVHYMDERLLIPTTAAANTQAALLVRITDPAVHTARHAGAIAGPPANAALWYYQVACGGN